jgi:hypothetical protein
LGLYSSYTAFEVLITNYLCQVRSSPSYESIVRLCWELARRGFIVATGGGPGAMEAGNMGAYLANKTEEEVTEAISIIRTPDTDFDSGRPEFFNTKPAKRVIERFGKPNYMPR